MKGWDEGDKIGVSGEGGNNGGNAYSLNNLKDDLRKM